jgi:hypothetical protein
MQGAVSRAGPFNLGAVLPMLDPEGFLARFLGVISAITIWQIIVLAIGLGVLYRRKSTGIMIGLLAAYGLIVAAGITIFGSLFG